MYGRLTGLGDWVDIHYCPHIISVLENGQKAWRMSSGRLREFSVYATCVQMSVYVCTICLSPVKHPASKNGIDSACTVWCNSRQYVTILEHVTILQSMSQYYRACCNTTEHVTILQSMLQYYRACCNTTEHVTILQSMLQYYRACCNT